LDIDLSGNECNLGNKGMSGRAKLVARTPEAKAFDSVCRACKPHFFHSVRSPIDQILHLQRTIGNQAVQGLFKSGVIRTKLKIGQPNDIYEQEADRVADEVMRMSEQTVQTKPA